MREMTEQETSSALFDEVERLRAENERLRAVLEDGCDLGLAPDECQEALAKCKD